MDKGNSYKRAERVGDQIRGEIADIISKKIKDPRIGLVTVASVVLTDDLKNARIFISPSVGVEEQESLKSLSRAAGFIKKELGRRLQLRFIPELVFKLETESPSRLLELLDQIKK